MYEDEIMQPSLEGEYLSNLRHYGPDPNADYSNKNEESFYLDESERNEDAVSKSWQDLDADDAGVPLDGPI